MRVCVHIPHPLLSYDSATSAPCSTSSRTCQQRPKSAALGRADPMECRRRKVSRVSESGSAKWEWEGTVG